MKNKKGFTFNLVTLIIVALVIVFTVVLFVRMYHLVHDTGNRELCNLEGVKNQVTNVKEVGFWKSYELKCRAEDVYLTAAKVDAIVWSQALSDFAKSQGPVNDSVIRKVRLEKYFADKLRNCWQITGNSSIIQWEPLPIQQSLGDAAQQRVDFFYYKQLATEGSLSVVPTQEPVSACMICSNTFFDSDLDSIPGNIDLRPYLQSVQNDDKATLWNALATQGGMGPSQVIDTHTPQSVVYYQWRSNIKYDRQALAKLDVPSNAGVIVIPTKNIPTMCDVVVNQQ